MEVKLKWITPNAEQMIIDCARVSSSKPAGSPGQSLLEYCIEHKHWSPFEMANMCLEINTTRDIARQVLRHRSFSFQEFSQRYADATNLGDAILRECRLQDKRNRQNSIALEDGEHRELAMWWEQKQTAIAAIATEAYSEALEKGIAKEVARVLLPEGMTPSKMYVNGTIRSWMHYLSVRWEEDAQAEHFVLADTIAGILQEQTPTIFSAFLESYL